MSVCKKLMAVLRPPAPVVVCKDTGKPRYRCYCPTCCAYYIAQATVALEKRPGTRHGRS